MKNQKLKYVLIPLVIIVWGLIFHKIFSYTNNNNFVYNDTNQKIETENIKLKKDTFILILDYNDPFLKKNKNIKTKLTNNTTNNNIIIKNQKHNNNRSRSRKQKYPIKPQFKPTIIEYGGKITNIKSEIKTAVVRIENKNKLLSDGDIVGKIKIIKIYNDSITIIDQGQKRTILKKIE